jgi:hypothetical protein
MQERLGQTLCSNVDCAIGWGEKSATKRIALESKIDRKVTRERKEAIKTRSDWVKDIQRVFNRYIVLRDDAYPCISCATYVLKTGFWSCGHFRTVGSSPHMRFVEDAAHKQCSSCNSGSEMYIKKRERVATAYESNLRLRIGDERVDAVKNDNTPRHYTIDQLKELKKHYAKLCKELVKLRESA